VNFDDLISAMTKIVVYYPEIIRERGEGRTVYEKYILWRTFKVQIGKVFR
jgi:hypothetical protein